MEHESFLNLIDRVRSGDDQAAADLVQRYAAQVRRIVRVRLTDPGLRRTVETMDICQSVLGSFFLRVAAGQFDLETPEQLVRLLATMARNKITNVAHREHAARRDVRRTSDLTADEAPLVADGGTPSQIVSQRELQEAFNDCLTEDEHNLVELRRSGRNWMEIAEARGQTADAVRMQYTRIVDRVAKRLRID